MADFSAADAALDTALSQPSNEGATAPDSSQESRQPQSTGEPTSGQPTVAELMELDKVEKFKFEGREWTPQELKSAYMMQQDYSKKTEEVARERKYYDNLKADLDSVRNNPALESKFKELYPEKFHRFLEYLPRDQAQVQPQSQSQQPVVPPEVANRIEKLEQFITQFETKNLEAEVEQAYSNLTQKYPMADERVVTASANLALQQGIALRGADGKLNVTELEKIFKAEHDRTQKAYEAHYKAQIDKQKQANARSRDVAGGGGVPGQAPVKRSFDEATKAAIADLTARH